MTKDKDAKEPNLIQNWEVSIGTYYSLATSFLAMLIIFALVYFISAKIDTLNKDHQKDLDTLNKKYAAEILTEYKNTLNTKDRYFNSSVNKIAKEMIDKKILAYAYSVNDKDGRVYWTTNHEDKEKVEGVVAKPPEAYTNQWVINTSTTDLNIKEVVEKHNGYTLKLGFFQKKEEIQALDFAMKIASIMAFIIAFFLSQLIGRFLKKPFDKLTIGINAFAKGNFKYRIQKTHFKEIDRIAESYNEMATKLYRLYESLESRVRERTVALEKTNAALEESNRKIQEAQGMMVHSEKMRSLGELVAGVAHEINNPVNFIYGNVIHLENYANSLFTLIDKYRDADSWLLPNKLEEIKQFESEIDLDFLKTDIHDLIESCKEGAERTKNIVLDLKNFSRMDEMVFTEFDVAKEIDTTLNILTNKFKNKVEIVKNYSPNVPKIEAYGGQLNQVFMNILDNSIHAIKEKGTITINVRRQTETSRNVVIEFIDTGVGISQENLKKVFEPFYTTKPVGEGTGLGMSIVYKVITSHGGTIGVGSEVGKGTTFRLTLPITQAQKTAEGKINE